MSSRNCVPKHAVLKYNTCIENDRLKMIGVPGEKEFRQNDRCSIRKKLFSKMIAEMIGSEKPENGRKKSH